MEKKKLIKKEQTVKTVEDFGSIVILTCMAVLFASSVVQPGAGLLLLHLRVQQDCFCRLALLLLILSWMTSLR